MKIEPWYGNRDYYKNLSQSEKVEYGNRILHRGNNISKISYSKKIRDYFESKDLKNNLEVKNIPLINSARLNVRARLGKKNIHLSLAKKLDKTYDIMLDQLANEPLEILIQNQIIGLGEVVVVDGNFGVQMTNVYEQPIEDKLYYQRNVQDKLDPVILLEAILGDIDLYISEILKFEVGSVIDFGIFAGSFVQVYVDKKYIGNAEVNVWEMNLGITLIDSKKVSDSKLFTLSVEDKEKFTNSISKIDEKVETNSYIDNFSFLNELSFDMLSTVLINEHPQTIAVTLLNINSDFAKDFLQSICEELSSEIIIRMSRIKHISDDSLLIVSSTLKDNYDARVKKVNVDGFDKVKDILSYYNPELRGKCINYISQIDEGLSDILEKGVEETKKE